MVNRLQASGLSQDAGWSVGANGMGLEGFMNKRLVDGGGDDVYQWVQTGGIRAGCLWVEVVVQWCRGLGSAKDRKSMST